MKNELLFSDNKVKKNQIESEIKLISKANVDDLFNENNTLLIPMRGIDVDCDVIDGVTYEKGEVEIFSNEIDELIEWCDEQDVDCYQDGEKLVVTASITAEEFAEGGLKMSEEMMEAEGQKVVTVAKKKYDKNNPCTWGKNYSKSRLVYSTKTYPNIVHCNKCDDSATENETSQYKWLLDGSDCAKSIRLGTLYFSNPTSYSTFVMCGLCVIESCQSLTGEGPNVYCNGKKKTGTHWNCSWFPGIWHTESFHYHK